MSREESTDLPETLQFSHHVPLGGKIRNLDIATMEKLPVPPWTVHGDKGSYTMTGGREKSI